MILGIDLIKKLNLIENLCEREIETPEGCGIDVRVGKLYEISDGEGFLHIEERKTPNYRLIADKGKVKLKSGEVYVGETIEVINTPLNIFGRFFPRGTLFKAGILVLGQKTDPGYKGTFSFVLINLSDRDFELEIGARIAQMVFYEVKGKTSPYKGQWQGGRAFIKEKERQV